MMQKRTVYSLLLISFILVFALNLSAQVAFEDKGAARCESSALNITVDPGSDVSAVEVVFEVTSASGGAFFDALNVNWDPGLTVLTNRIVDLSGVDYVSPDTVRIAAMLIDAGDACLPSGQTVIAQVQFTTNDVCDGEVVLDAGVVSCPSFDVETQFVDCATTTTVAAAVTAGTVTVSNTAPTVDPIADATIHWGDVFSEDIIGDDLDLANGCEALTYSLVSGPGAMSVNASTGSISWATTGGDICEHVVEVAVEDACGATATTSFTICVQNTPPVIECPDDTLIALGTELIAQIDGSDPDGGPAALTYSLVDFDGPGMASVSAATGEFHWQTMLDDSYKGTWTATVAVSDGAATCDPCSPSNADTCSFTITVVSYLITIEKTHNAFQGQEEEVTVYMQDSNFENFPMGGFDFLFQYDNSALTFQFAEPGQFIEDCGWEYFTYRYGPNGNCGNACPSGEVRVVAIAETNNGEGNHPDCFTNADPAVSNQLVVLHFLVTNDRTFECMYAPVRFFWYDCGDNTISSQDGNYLFISNHVYNFEDTTGAYSIDNADPSVEFPSQFGANYTCDIQPEDTTKPHTMRFIDFVNGGVDIVCADSIDARGDLNLNEIPNEIADAVLYSNYFIYGTSVFTVNLEGQIAASDVNADGLTLSVADLVYLIRIVVGDAQPYPKEVVLQNATYKHANGLVSVDENINVAAAAIVVAGNVTPVLEATNMRLAYNFDGENTRILVSPDPNAKELTSFTGNMLSGVNGEIVSIEMADAQGNPVAAKWIPSNFQLMQNYPNPFNPTTTVSFMLPVASDYELVIYNVNGQKVNSFQGAAEAGMVELEVDFSTVASGVYFYRLSAGDFSDVKKMVLLK